jgi:molybdenum-dependent DNA-binding transcriptional regulator ModE
MTPVERQLIVHVHVLNVDIPSGYPGQSIMETRRLELLAELSRLGSMRAVADVLGTTTSSVSQQIAVLAREMGTPLIEPAGRGSG